MNPSIPTLPGGPIGVIRGMRGDPLALFARARAVGDVVRFPVPFQPVFAVLHPDLVHRVLVADADATWKGSRGARLLRRVLGPGLLTTEGAQWKARRRLAQPHFKREALAAIPGIVERNARALAERWSAGGQFDVAADLNHLALEIVCEALFGRAPGADADVVSRALEEVLGGFLWMTTFPIDGVDGWPLPASRRHRRAVAELEGVVDRVIAARRASGDRGDDLLATWLSAEDRGELTAVDVRAEVITMLLAGHETTANAMAWTLGLLAKHPEEQARAAASPERLAGAIHESLRLFPPAWITARATREPIALGDVTIPAGAFVFMPVHTLQHDPRWWPDPERFDPGRPEDPSRPKLAWMPFGAGSRKCIGEHFAMTEAKITLGVLLESLDFALAPGQELVAQPSITLRPRGGLALDVRPRAVRTAHGGRVGAQGCPFHAAV